MNPLLFAFTIVPLSTDDELSWSSMGFGSSVASVAIDEQKRVLVLGQNGILYRLEAGSRWQQMLSVETMDVNEEDILLDAESTMGEVLEGVDESGEYYDEETEETIIVEGQESFDDEVQGGIFDPLRDQEKVSYSPILHVTGNHILLCLEECYESRDNGRSWRNPDVPYVHDLISFEIDNERVYLAATQEGLWKRTQNQQWKLATPSMRTLPFQDLEIVGDRIVVGSSHGLYVSQDTEIWTRKGTMQNIVSIAYDQEALFLSTSSGLYYSTNLGETSQKVHPDIPSVSLQSSEQGLWCYGNDFLSLISGEGIRSQFRSLASQRVYSVQPWREGVLIGTGSGLYWLTKERDFNLVQMPHSLEEVLLMALQDSNRQAEQLSIQSPLLRGSLAPVLSITGTVDRDLGITVDFGGISTFAQENISWSIGMDICFGRCGAVASTFADTLREDELMVVNGSVYSRGGVAAAATGLELGLTKLRKNIYERTIGLYQHHRQLLMQGEQMRSSVVPLKEKVFYELELAEVVSLLDAYTAGQYGNQ